MAAGRGMLLSRDAKGPSRSNRRCPPTTSPSGMPFKTSGSGTSWKPSDGATGFEGSSTTKEAARSASSHADPGPLSRLSFAESRRRANGPASGHRHLAAGNRRTAAPPLEVLQGPYRRLERYRPEAGRGHPSAPGYRGRYGHHQRHRGGYGWNRGRNDLTSLRSAWAEADSDAMVTEGRPYRRLRTDTEPSSSTSTTASKSALNALIVASS